MNDKQKIKAKIGKLKSEYNKESDFRTVRGDTAREVLDKLLSFIDSLPEEPASEDLNDEIERFLDENENIPSYSKTARHFAEWKESQLMKDGIEGEIGDIMPFIEVGEVNNYLNYVKAHGLKPGDKVKVILIKEEEK